MLAWLKSLFGRSPSNRVLSTVNQRLMDGYREPTVQALTVLKSCRTRQQVIDGLRKLAVQRSDIAGVAAQAARALEDDFTLDAFRIRDDMVRTLEAFMSSTRNL